MTDQQPQEQFTEAREVESTGIVAELARDDVERKRFLKMAGRGIGSAAAASGLAAFIAACGSSATSGTSSSTPAGSAATTTGTAAGNGATGGTTTAAATGGDLAIVNYALTLEYIESQFYAKVVASGLFSGSTLKTLKQFGAEEAEHVVALRTVAAKLGKPAPKPATRFPLDTASKVADLAASVENLGASAYLGQAPHIQSAEILAAALSIHTIEARHAATLNTLIKRTPTPDGAFAKPMSMSQVLKVVHPFIA